MTVNITHNNYAVSNATNVAVGPQPAVVASPRVGLTRDSDSHVVSAWSTSEYVI